MAMMTIIKYLVAMVIMATLSKGTSAQNCNFANLTVGTERTGREVQGKPEWKVTVLNNCRCAQSSIILGCSGWKTTEPVDPDVFGPLPSEKEKCLLKNHGSPVHGKDAVSFNYAWDPPFLLLPFSSTVGGPCG